MKFEQIDETSINILDDSGNKVGQIFSPSGSGNTNSNAIQVCGFSEAFDFWGCGVFEGFKDIQLLFDGKKMDGKFNVDLDDRLCMKCYMTPCQCEVKDEKKIPFLVKRESNIKDRITKAG